MVTVLALFRALVGSRCLPPRQGKFFELFPCVAAKAKAARCRTLYARMAARLNLLILSLAVHFASSAVVISEVADKGSSSQCGAGNEDWVELHNAGSASVSLAGWKLHDDKGPSDSKAFTFSSTTPLAAGEYLLLCTRMDDAATSPQFKIGGDDTVTLLDASGAVVSSTGALQDLGELDLTWAYNAATSSWRYTSTPTPGQANVFTDSWPALRARLTKQHDDGEAFFEASHITIAAGRLPPVVEVRLTLSAEDWAFQLANVSYEVYKPFTGLTVTSGDGSVTHATLANGGRARPRGMHKGSNPRLGISYSRVRALPLDRPEYDGYPRLFGTQDVSLVDRRGERCRQNAASVRDGKVLPPKSPRRPLAHA